MSILCVLLVLFCENFRSDPMDRPSTIALDVCHITLAAATVANTLASYFFPLH
jgi:hypothetical protein